MQLTVGRSVAQDRADAQASEAQLRMEAALSRTCPPAVLAALVSDENRRVRDYALLRPETPAAALAGYLDRLLEGLPERGVLRTMDGARAMLTNPACPGDLVERFARDVLTHRDMASEKLLQLAVSLVLAHPNCPGSLVRWMAETGSLKMLRSMAGHFGVTEEAARVLLASDDARVREQVVSNLVVPRSLVEAHLEREDSIRVMLRMLPRTSGEAKERLLRTLAERSMARNVWVRVAAETRDPDLLARAGASRWPAVREAAAANPACPEEGQVAAALLRP